VAAVTLLSPVIPILEVRDLRVVHGGAEVVHGVSLRVFAGTIATILGSNGCGKSSTLLAIARLLRAFGTVTLGGRRMDPLSSQRVVRWGLVHVPQHRGVIPELSVRENLLLGAWTRRDRYAMKNEAAMILDRFPDLGARPDARARELTATQQQLLAIGRALMAKPRMLLIDEPSAGLPPEGVAEIFAVLAQLNGEGIPILLAEQYERKALAISDYAYVMERGKIVAEGVARQMLHEAPVANAHLGAP
jgi:branched-chain amino acid transport system ATP-binding protein